MLSTPMNMSGFNIEEGIIITDEEIPLAIRGPWKSDSLLRNETPFALGGHSAAVADVIEAAIVGSGASTKKDVLDVLERLASER